MARSMRSFVALFISFLFMVQPILLVGAQAPGVPIVILDPLIPGEAQVNPNIEGMAEFASAVRVEKPPLVTVTVQIEGNCDTGWGVVVVPSSMVFTEAGSEDIAVTVNVPQGTPANLEGLVTVTMVATWPGGRSQDSQTAKVIIIQHYQAEVFTKPDRGLENPQEFKLTIRNEGNGNDTFRLEIDQRSELEKDGLDFVFSKTRTKELAPLEEEEITLTVSYGPMAESGEKILTVRAISLGLESSGNDTFGHPFTLYIVVDHFSGGGLLTYGMIATVIIVVIAISLLMLRRRKRRKKGRRSARKKAEEEE